jgi:hypothetical protein
MPLYEMTTDSFSQIDAGSFPDLGIGERSDIQRLLRNQIDVLGEELLVIAEEFGEWKESKRRIDLLALDRNAHLVVIELKRTNDGGHMELQALRYASMVAAMTFERASRIYAEFRKQAADVATRGLLDFLGWTEPDEDAFANDVRIVLVSADFSKELTTAVLWLRERAIDIRCIRLKPYSVAGKTLVDVQPVIPLPEAEEYTIRLREKEQQERRNREGRWSEESKQFCLDYWNGVLDLIRLSGILEPRTKARRLEHMRFRVHWPQFALKAYFSRRLPKISVWLQVRGPDASAHYATLKSHRGAIETAFGRPLLWQDDQDCITYRIEGHDATAKSDWLKQHAMIAEAVIGLFNATKRFVEPLLGDLVDDEDEV